MTNLLLDTLPTKVEVNAAEVEIETDFRIGIKFEIAIERGDINIPQLIKMFFPHKTPEDITAATNAIIWFYRCGEEKKETNKPTKETKRGYSFECDAAVIYADFLRYYDIDLTTVNMHWWKFRELLAGLPIDSAFKKRIYYRTCDLKGLSKAEQKRIRAIRKEIEIDKIDKGAKITLAERNSNMLLYVQKRTTEAKSEVK